METSDRDIAYALSWQRYCGYDEDLLKRRDTVARVVSENKTNYSLLTLTGVVEGVVRGKMLQESKVNHSLPRVGDWVNIERVPNEEKAVIESILPRKTHVARTDADGNTKVVVANTDIIFIVQGLDDDFSISRLERFLTIVKEGKSQPVIILNKCDLVDDVQTYIDRVHKIAPSVAIITMNAKARDGLDVLQSYMRLGMTVALVGSSGAGKSTIINALFDKDVQATADVRKNSKGRHTTTRREMFILSSGAMVIDTPGIREVGVGESSALDTVFADVEALTAQCRYRKCDHKNTEGCALRDAVQKGTLDENRYQSYLKIKSNTEDPKTKKRR
jgi:ribosome biogenesis GTPase